MNFFTNFFGTLFRAPPKGNAFRGAADPKNKKQKGNSPTGLFLPVSVTDRRLFIKFERLPNQSQNIINFIHCFDQDRIISIPMMPYL